MTTDLTELSLLDDLDIDTADPERYRDPIGPAPLPAGKYTFRLTDWEFDKTKEGVIRNQKNPTIKIHLEVVAPSEYAGRKVRFLRINSTVFERDGVKVSQLGDLLRAFDARANYRGKDKFTALSRYQQQGATFDAKVDWRAFDTDHYKALGGSPTADKMTKRTAGDAATIRGMRRFKTNGNGSYLPIVDGPSGNELKAELEIVDFVVNK